MPFLSSPFQYLSVAEQDVLIYYLRAFDVLLAFHEAFSSIYLFKCVSFFFLYIDGFGYIGVRSMVSLDLLSFRAGWMDGVSS
jgi:hypothetical protein